MGCANDRCIDGWLYSGVGGMVFPANERCPDCNKGEEMNKKDEGWIGVDLDGTLAFDNGNPFQPGYIGPPVDLMVSRVKRWLAQGKDVRIVTARVSTDGSNARNWEKQQSIHAIEAWCERFIGRKLPITNQKDYMMRELWDDRAVQVNRNTGFRADGVPE